jgi:hypothetical protein
MALLVIVFLGTTGQAIWQLAQSTSSTAAMIVEVTETLTSSRSAIYNLSLQTDQDGRSFVQLRNNGRILNYLLAQEHIRDRRVIVEQRGGAVLSLTFVDDDDLTIRESRIMPMIQLIIGLFPLLILLLHIRPNLIEQRSFP